MLNREAIRLVIWDLDETFWRGTLSEEGISEYVQEHHNIVIELAKRGIISSICSKNDYSAVKEILQKQGIWEYFILPSIDWTTKGPRLQQLISDIQLRPETVLFIDDNASNRAEAAAHIPGLQIADETIISTILTSDLFTGKNDPDLTRLKQYQLLQHRKSDEKTMGSDNIAFLRSSNIYVTIEPNVELYLDRTIELINRTNQLNFTKNRITDDETLERNALKTLLSRHCIQAGLVRVWDKYGDYGFCGLYILYSIHNIKKLIHFCFSCRILGMGIERWLYNRLEKPSIQIKGTVQADLKNEEPIDWINQNFGGAILFAEGNENALPLSTQGEVLQALAPEIRLQGGCELDALSHYLRQETPNLVMHTNYVNGGFLIRQDSTINMNLSLTPLPKEIKTELDTLGIKPTDYDGHIFASPQPGSLFVISTWGDMYLPAYRHKTLGFEVAMGLRMPGLFNLTAATPEQIEDYLRKTTLSDEQKEDVRKTIQHLSAHYIYVQYPGNGTFYRNWQNIFKCIPKDCLLVVLLPNIRRASDTILALQYHHTVQEAAQNFSNIFTLDITPYINHEEEKQDGAVDHLNRMVYFNVYKDLLHEFGKRLSLMDKQRSGTETV